MRVGDAAGAARAASPTERDDGGLRLPPKRSGHGPKATPAEPPRLESPAPSPFGQLVRALGREVDRGEATVKKVLHPGGADMGPSELLALQAGIYRYSEAVDLSAKLVDRATSGLKTVLSGQG